MFRTLTIFFLAIALVLSAVWGSFYIFHLYPVADRDFEWWMLPMFISVLLADLIILLIGYALLKVITEKIKET